MRSVKYKLIRKNFRKQLVSVYPPNGAVKHIFEANKWNKAPIGGFLVFDTLNDAIAYYHYIAQKDVKVWRVEVSRQIKLPDYGLWFGTERDLQRLWRNKKLSRQDLMCVITFNWPCGTVAYKFVKPLEVLDV